MQVSKNLNKVVYSAPLDELTFLQHKFYTHSYYAAKVWVWVHKTRLNNHLEIGNEFGFPLPKQMQDKIELQLLEWSEEFKSVKSS